MLLAATLNFGFFIGDIANPDLHNIYELFAALAVSLIATVLKFGDRTQIGAVHLATSLVADLQLIAAGVVWVWAAEISAAGTDRGPHGQHGLPVRWRAAGQPGLGRAAGDGDRHLPPRIRRCTGEQPTVDLLGSAVRPSRAGSRVPSRAHIESSSQASFDHLPGDAADAGATDHPHRHLLHQRHRPDVGPQDRPGRQAGADQPLRVVLLHELHGDHDRVR